MNVPFIHFHSYVFYLAMKCKQKKDESTLSEYEQQRLKRIEENTRMLVQLVSSDKENFIDV